jgi:hypothetical protein
MEGTYSSKELRITPARSHSQQGSIRIYVCVCPSNASAMDQRDRVWTGRVRAEPSHAPRSPPTRASVLSQIGIHKFGSFRRVAGGSRIVDEKVGACECPIGKSTGKFGFAYSGFTTWTQQKTALPEGACKPRRRTPNDIASLSHQIFSLYLCYRFPRWQLLHPLRNGLLTSIRHLLQSQSRVESQTLLGSHLLEAR